MSKDIKVKESILNDKLARKQKQSTELEEQIKEKKETIANLNIQISALSMVKMILTQIVRNLIREKKRLQFSYHLII